MKRKAMKPAVVGCLLSVLALPAQGQEAAASTGNAQAGPGYLTTAASADVTIRYGKGSAPFFFRAAGYARHLRRMLESGREEQLEREAAALGISLAELTPIAMSLSEIIPASRRARREELRAACAPRWRGQVFTNAENRAFLVGLNDQAKWDALAEAVVAEQGDAALSARLKSRIVEYGSNADVSSTDIVKTIDLDGGDFVSYMADMCGPFKPDP